jgi:predicted outer membrane repeat protein
MEPKAIKQTAWLLVLLLGTFGHAAAATFTVTNINNSGAGSLRQAVDSSNSAAGSDTIVFDPAVFSTPQTIQLLNSIVVGPAPGESLTITGPGANLLTIRGNGAADFSGQIFSRDGNRPHGFSVSGMTLTNAGFTAIANPNTGPQSSLTVTNVTFVANSNSFSGGAITNEAALTVTNCTFTNNTSTSAGGGGAIISSISSSTAFTATISGSTFTGNRLTNGGPGGAIRNAGGTMTIAKSGFTNNTITGGGFGSQGGAINNEGSGTMSISNCIISGNSTSTDAQDSHGGGMASSGPLTIAGSTITGNSAARDGGGIYRFSGGTLTLTNSTVSNNTANSDNNATGSGGGMYFRGDAGSATISGSTINGNQALGNSTSAGNGGGIDVSSVLDLTHSTVSGNTAGRNGGGIYAQGISTTILTINSSTVARNTATGDGGGLVRASSSNPVNLRNTIVADNSATGTAKDILGAVVSQGYNLIENITGATFSGDTTTNITGTDPNLGPLANNGGPTQTHALVTGSAAIDKGASGGLTSDQRGETRPVDDPLLANQTGGDGADIGAFELQPKLQFNAATYSVNEAIGTVTITVTRAGGTNGSDTVQYATSNGSAVGGATCVAGVDYISRSGTLTFAAGVATQSFTITICADAVSEPDETVNLVLSTPAGATLGTPSTAILTIKDPPILLSASSDLVHGGAGTFSVPLPLTGPSVVEPRLGGGTGAARNYTIVFRFDRPVSSGTAAVTGTASVSAVTFSGANMSVSLTGVTSPQTVTVTVANVATPQGGILSSASVQVGFLVGDVNGDRVVNIGDATVTRANSGAAVTTTNFRADVNIDGVINAADALIVRGRSGTGL